MDWKNQIDILVCIFCFLSFEQIVQLRRVYKKWGDHFNSPRIYFVWKLLYQRECTRTEVISSWYDALKSYKEFLFHVSQKHLWKGYFRHNKDVWCVDVCGDYVASASCDKSVQIHKVNFKLCSAFLGHEAQVGAVRFLNAETLASGDDNGLIKIWKWRDLNHITTFRGHSGYIWGICYQGEDVVTAGDSTVRGWDLETATNVYTFQGHKNYICSVSIHKDLIVSGGSDSIAILRDKRTPASMQLLDEHKSRIDAVHIDQQGILTGSYDRSIRLWDLRMLTKSCRVWQNTSYVTSLAVSGNILLSGDGGGFVKVWHRNRDQLVCNYDEHYSPIRSIALNHSILVDSDASGIVFVRTLPKKAKNNI